MNVFDYFAIAIVVFFAVLSSIRGFFDEAISIVTLILTVIGTYFFGAILQIFFNSFISIAALSLVLSYGASFVIIFLSSQTFAKSLLSKLDINTSLDKLLGMFFGALKGFLVVFVIVAILSSIFIENPPVIFDNSYVIKYIEGFEIKDKISSIIQQIIPAEK